MNVAKTLQHVSNVCGHGRKQVQTDDASVKNVEIGQRDFNDVLERVVRLNDAQLAGRNLEMFMHR